MCTLQWPKSQVMSNTSAMAITDFYRGGGGGGGLGTTLLLRLRSKKNRSSYAGSSLFDHVQNKIFLLILDVSFLDPRKKLFIFCYWKSHTSE